LSVIFEELEGTNAIIDTFAFQEVVQLTFFKGLSQRDIAAQDSISLGTVKTRLRLAREKLLNQLMPTEQNLTLQKVSSCWMGGSRHHGTCCHRNVSYLGVKPTNWKR
jgi:predicted DNA-binding protein (UPF0251 family)